MKEYIRRMKKKISAFVEKMRPKIRKIIRRLKKTPSVKLRSVNLLMVSITLMLLSFSSDTIRTSYLLSTVGDNTVFIHSPAGAKIQGSATGFEVIAPSGKIFTLTNAHVCELAKDGVVMVGEKQNSHRLIPKRVIEVYSDNDLCLVEGLQGYGGLSLASSVGIGDLNYAIGYPLGEEMNLSSGYIKGYADVQIVMMEIPINKCVAPMKMIELDTIFGSIPTCSIIRHAVQTNIPIYPGNSGSAMVNAFGHVTGVVFASNRSTAWGSAVPLSDVIAFLKPY